VGRVIRRQSDYGIAILLDDRFQNGVYQDLMPKVWKPYTIIKHQTDLSETLANFWKIYEK
jgi:DNA excision repair protein ERCC-2